jgi:hypothetical protein
LATLLLGADPASGVPGFLVIMVLCGVVGFVLQAGTLQIVRRLTR